MTDQITIRKATLSDAGHIAEFNEKMALETEGITLIPDVISAGVRRLITHDKLGFYLVAEVRDKSVHEIAGEIPV